MLCIWVAGHSVALSVLMVAGTVQTKLALETGGIGKKAYEKCGSVSKLM